MTVRMTAFACLIVGVLQPSTSCVAGTGAVLGTFVPASARKDMVYDDKRDVLYISDHERILRYAVADARFLPAIEIGGSPHGLDLSPDGNTLAIADAAHSPATLWIKLVDLDGLQVRTVEFNKVRLENGMWAVSFLADGSVVATSQFAGSGWTPMRRIDVATGAATTIASVMQDTMVAASGDRKVIAFAESNNSAGPWGRYNAPTGQVNQAKGTSAFNYEIATDAAGTQFAIPTYAGTHIYDEHFVKLATFGTFAGPQPLAVAYDPVDHLAYFPWVGSSEVRVYDMELLAEVASYDVGYTFEHTNLYAYNSGRVRVSGDGSLLMVSVAGGVRIVRMYAPLQAASFSISAPRRLKYKFRLQGSIGNDGALDYEIAQQPKHGRVTVSRGYATYVGRGSGAGSDSFVYRVRYGRTAVEGVVTVNTR